MRWKKTLTMVEAHAEGEVGRIVTGGVIGYARDTTVAGRPAVVPNITGRGRIHGIHQIGLDPSDPYPEGFRVADTWGDAFDLLK